MPDITLEALRMRANDEGARADQEAARAEKLQRQLDELAKRTADITKRAEEQTSAPIPERLADSELLGATRARHNVLSKHYRLLQSGIRRLQAEGRDTTEQQAKLDEMAQTMRELVSVKAENRQLSLEEIYELQARVRGELKQAEREGKVSKIEACRKELARLHKERSYFCR